MDSLNLALLQLVLSSPFKYRKQPTQTTTLDVSLRDKRRNASSSDRSMARICELDTAIFMDDGTEIKTTITSSGDAVERFLREVRGDPHQRLIVGIDTKRHFFFQPGSRQAHRRTAVLQLCVGRRCLIFHIVNADYVPDALRRFLASPDVCFCGLGVDDDAKLLSEDRGLKVANAVELATLAAETLSRPELRGAGFKTLAREVMGVCIYKPKRVRMSDWDERPLSWEQVQYACIDAYVFHEVGILLHADEFAKRAGTCATISPSVEPLWYPPKMEPGWIHLP
ncbi:hypothetical protein ACP70R_038009 [Stipagrostis hirtigluma subsp. patula]